MAKKFKHITIAEKLRKEKCKVLGLGWLDKKKWAQIERAYWDSEHDPKFVESNNWRKDPDILRKIKLKTREIISQKYNKKTHDMYVMAKKWSVAPHTLKKRALKMGFTFLNLDLDSDKDLETWEMRVKEYNPNDNEINLIPILRMHDPKIGLKKKVRNLKITARKLINLMNYEEYSEEAWNSIIRWFTKDRPFKEFV